MAKLKANLCVNCRIPIGYITDEALEIPTMCIICASDPEVMEEWEHEILSSEKPAEESAEYYRAKLMDRWVKK